jgi:hypothetical protein
VTTTDEAARQRLAEFLRSRRERLRPADFGLPGGGRRRTPGLRREEVALLAGIGVTWYTWLEQARPIAVSDQVLDSLAHTLRLDTVERGHLFALAGRETPAADPATDLVPPVLQGLLDQQQPSPAYAMGRRWDVLAWNQAADALFSGFEHASPESRNLIWRLFLDPAFRDLMVDWEGHAQLVLAQFRVTWGHHAADPSFRTLVEQLQTESPDFRDWWPRHDVQGRSAAQRQFRHPRAGRLTLDQVTLRLGEAADLRVVLYVPSDDETRAGLIRLTEV